MNLQALIELRAETLHDVNAFLEAIFAPGFRQGAIHREGQAWLTQHQTAMICWPRDHGKTTQIAGRVAWEIGRNPDVRVKYTCEADDIAYHRSRFVRRLVTAPWFRFVFPQVHPAEPWGDVSWTVTRPRVQVDPTFNALGVGTASTGGRADLLVADDLVGVKQFRSRVLREQTKEFWKNNLVNLCEPNARIWVIYTPWRADDLNADLEHRMPCLRRPIGPNCEPVWPEHWSQKALQDRREAVGPHAFARGYQLATVADNELLVPDVHVAAVPTKPQRCVIGVDLAVRTAESNDRSAIAVLYYDGQRWVVVQCWSGRVPMDEVLAVLASLAEMHRPQAIAYEDAGQQEGIWALARQHGPASHLATLLRPVKHTRHKLARLEAAVPHLRAGKLALAGEGLLVLPELQALFDELTSAPLAEHDDTWDAMLTAFEYATLAGGNLIR